MKTPCPPDWDGRNKPGHDDKFAGVCYKVRMVSILQTVALLEARPAFGLARGQVGTVVGALDESTVLVEFSGDDGRAYAIEPIPRAELLVLHYVPEAAE